jgi:hypothetical protein
LLVAGRSTGLRVTAIPSAFPERKSPVAFAEGQLSAYSCGGSRGFEATRLSPRSHLASRMNAGTDDGRNYRLTLRRRKQDRLAMASPLTRLPARSFSGGENDGLLEDEE